jgi:hypothetical protein
MKRIKLFEEFKYGKRLFADPQTVTNATGSGRKYGKWLAKNGGEEEDTPEEQEALMNIAGYIEDDVEQYGKEAAKFLNKNGKSLKKKYPQILNPTYDKSYFDGSTIYRGSSLPVEEIVKAANNDKKHQKRIMSGGDVYNFIMDNPRDWLSKIEDFMSTQDIKNKDYSGAGPNWIALDVSQEVKSQNKQGFLSFTTGLRHAAAFGSGQGVIKMKAGRWNTITGVDYKKVEDRTYLNPAWTSEISSWREMEVWVLGNSIPAQRIWVKSPYSIGIHFPRSNNYKLGHQIAKALYFQHIDPVKFEEALKSKSMGITTNKIDDERWFKELKSESFILNPPK